MTRTHVITYFIFKKHMNHSTGHRLIIHKYIYFQVLGGVLQRVYVSLLNKTFQYLQSVLSITLSPLV